MTRAQESASVSRTARPVVARSSGFTLIELLAVMAIIVMLMALIIGAGVFARRAGMRATAKAQIQQIQTALQEYNLQNGTYPTVLLYSDIATWIKATTTKFATTNNVLIDPWSRPYQYYTNQSGSYTLFSLGERDSLAADDIYPGR